MLKWMRDRDSPGMQLAVNNMENVLRGKKMYFSLLSKKFKLFWTLKSYAVKMWGSSRLRIFGIVISLLCPADLPRGTSCSPSWGGGELKCTLHRDPHDTLLLKSIHICDLLRSCLLAPELQSIPQHSPLSP